MTDPLTISVIICAHTTERWKFLIEAVNSVKAQSLQPLEIILVIDHNPTLFEKATIEFSGVRVIKNQEIKGASGAKNSGVRAAMGDVVAFLDDDARAESGWLGALQGALNDPAVFGVGGLSLPLWPDLPPPWFPAEFFWVVGCTYRGTPEMITPVRNLIACNMAVRKRVFTQVGGFRPELGPMGPLAMGCEETEFCIRASQILPKGIWLHQPAARVWHHVSSTRTGFRYFLRRCYGEGRSKAILTSLTGSKDGLASERRQVLKILPEGIFHGMIDTILLRDRYGFLKAGAMTIGLLVTLIGYGMTQIISFSTKITHPIASKQS